MNTQKTNQENFEILKDGKVEFYCARCDIISYETKCYLCGNDLADINEHDELIQCIDCLNIFDEEYGEIDEKGIFHCNNCYSPLIL